MRNTFTRVVWAGLAPVVLGVLLGLCAFGATRPTDGKAYEFRLVVGIASSWSNFGTGGWHGPGTNLDLNTGLGTTAGMSVYWQSAYISGSRGMDATTVYHPGSCTGQDIYVADGTTGSPLGNYWFVHIQGIGAGSYFWVGTGTTWTIKYMGSILSDEAPACKNAVPPLWTGPHLHQGGDNTASTKIYTNWGLTGTNPISPTGDYTNKWMHKYLW
jgi:hypothetical protein